MRKHVFPILIPFILFACGKSLPDGARYISPTDTSFSADIRSISTKINDDPTNPENYYLRGNAFFYALKYKDAITDLNTAVALNGDNPMYHFRLAESYLSLDSANYDLSNKHLSACLKLRNNNYPEAAFLLAKLYVARQQYSDADKLLSGLISNPEFQEKAYILKSVSLKEQKDTLASLAIIDKVLLLNPNNFDATMQKALFLFEKDPALCEKYVNKAIVLNEFSDEAIYTKGLIEQKKSNFSDAVKLYEKVIKINPYHIYAYYNRAVVETMFENYQVAAELCDKITTLNPKFDKAYVLRGYDFMMLGDKNAAVDNFTKALKLNPNSNQAKEYLEDIKSLKSLKPVF